MSYFLVAALVFLSPFSTFASAPLAQIIKIPPGGSKTIAYKNLACSDKDRAMIAELITTMGENGKLSLLMKQSHLKEIGVRINHVHPLKFLAVIFSQAPLKAHMNVIFDDYFIRSRFMDGLAPRLDREAEKKTLDLYAKDFAKEVKVPVDNIRTFFQSRDWENFVRYLMRYEP
jgi:hypothetical protein